MKHLFAVMCVWLASMAQGEDRSVISVPVSIAISGLEALANEHIPVDLDRRTSDLACVDTFLLSITGRVRYHIWREGPMRITADNGNLVISQNVGATLNVDCEIASETATGSAAFIITAAPRLNDDWSIGVDLDVDFTWINRPTVELLDLVDVTFGSEGERALRKAIDEFKRDDLPAFLAGLDLKEEVQEIWSRLHDPLPIDVPRAVPLFLHLQPDAVGRTPIAIASDTIGLTLSFAGKTRVTDNAASPFGPPAALPDLTDALPAGVDIRLPILVGFDTLNAQIAQDMPLNINAGALDVQLDQVALAERANGHVAFTLEGVVSRGRLQLYQGSLLAVARPEWDAAQQSISLAGITFERTGGLTNGVITQLANSGALNAAIESAGTASLKAELQEIAAALNAALRVNDVPQLALDPDLRISISDVAVTNGLSVFARAQGTISAQANAFNQ